jgi:hypothetical protein
MFPGCDIYAKLVAIASYPWAILNSTRTKMNKIFI